LQSNQFHNEWTILVFTVLSLPALSMLSLKKLALQGTLWTVLGYGASQGIRFVSNLILTRLLFPDLFGLMALAYTFLTGLHLFSDVGIRPSIVQNARGDDPVFLNTAWTIQVIRGFGLWICCLLIAWPVATFYHNSTLVWLIPVLGLTAILEGFCSTQLATLSRNLEIGKLTQFELGIQLIAAALMLIWAYFSRSIWPLVGSGLFAAILKLVWSHRLGQSYTNRFAWDAKVLKELFQFGRWIFLSTAMTFLASQADRLILGRLFPIDLLGIYIIAFTLSDLPQQVIQAVGSNVVFPVLSQQSHLPRATLRQQLLEKRNLFLLASAVGLTGLICFGDLLIQGLYDQRYRQAAWMLPILALGNWPRMLPTTTAPALIAVGKPLYAAVGNLLKFIYMVVVLPLGFYKMGALGAIIAIAFNDVPFYLATSYGLWREGFSGLKQDFQTTCFLLLCVAVVLGVRYQMGLGFPIDSIL
jgi:O-antigen/teichoic acid export membrane protein